MSVPFGPEIRDAMAGAPSVPALLCSTPEQPSTVRKWIVKLSSAVQSRSDTRSSEADSPAHSPSVMRIWSTTCEA